jgi:predicted phage tail protein
MKVVKVYGALRELLGATRFEFVADTPAQAMRALLANFPQLEQWLIDSERNGVAYRVTLGKEKIYDEDVSGFFMPWSERDVFAITPVLTGAGRGVGTFILGAVLVGVAIFNPFVGFSFAKGGFAVVGTGLTGAAAAGAGLAAAAGTLGIGLMLAGVAQMLSPVPRPPGPGEAPTQLESNSFSGVANTTRQGVPVPITYGRVVVGSAVISAGLDVDEVAT